MAGVKPAALSDDWRGWGADKEGSRCQRPICAHLCHSAEFEPVPKADIPCGSVLERLSWSTNSVDFPISSKATVFLRGDSLRRV